MSVDLLFQFTDQLRLGWSECKTEVFNLVFDRNSLNLDEVFERSGTSEDLGLFFVKLELEFC